jgi:hypothetical protein
MLVLTGCIWGSVDVSENLPIDMSVKNGFYKVDGLDHFRITQVERAYVFQQMDKDKNPSGKPRIAIFYRLGLGNVLVAQDVVTQGGYGYSFAEVSRDGFSFFDLGREGLKKMPAQVQQMIRPAQVGGPADLDLKATTVQEFVALLKVIYANKQHLNETRFTLVP